MKINTEKLGTFFGIILFLSVVPATLAAVATGAVVGTLSFAVWKAPEIGEHEWILFRALWAIFFLCLIPMCWERRRGE